MNHTEWHQPITGRIVLENIQGSFETLREVMTSLERVCRALITSWLWQLPSGQPAMWFCFGGVVWFPWRQAAVSGTVFGEEDRPSLALASLSVLISNFGEWPLLSVIIMGTADNLGEAARFLPGREERIHTLQPSALEIEWLGISFWVESTFFFLYQNTAINIYGLLLTKINLTASCSVMSDSWRPHGTVAHQASLSMEFSRQEYWGGLPCPPPEDLSDPVIEPASRVSPALAGGVFTAEPPGSCQS